MTFSDDDEIYNKFNKNDWNTIEKNELSNIDKLVLHRLNDYVVEDVDNKNNLTKIKLLPCEISSLLFDVLVKKIKNIEDLNEKNILKIISNSKDSKKKLSAITVNNFIITYNTFVKNINMKKMYTINKIPNGILNLNLLEYIILFHCILLMQYINKIVNINSDVIYQYMACKIILKKCNNFESLNYFNPSKKIKINDYILKTVKEIIAKVDKLYRIDLCTAYDKHPISLCVNEYNYLPDNNISLRCSQIKLLDSIKNNYNVKNTLIILKSSTGSGKTTSIIPIATFLKNYKLKLMSEYEKNKKIFAKEIKDLNNTYVIFCCNLKQVKTQVASLCYHSNIDFSIAHTEIIYYNENGDKVYGKKTNNFNEEVIITKSNRYDKTSKSTVLITDPYTAKKLKEINNNYENCILFIDEPTNNLERKKTIAFDNCNLMLNITKMTILSSTTLPNETSKSIKYIYDNMKNNYGNNSKLISIKDNNVIIGHTVYDMKGNIILPTIDSKNINKICENIFLSKFYTPIIYNLLNKITNKNSEIISTENNNNNYIKDSCIKTICEESKNIKINNFNSIIDSIDMSLLGGEQAYKFNNMTLIVFDDDIINKTLNMFKSILTEFDTNMFKDMLKKKDQDDKNYQHNVKIAENQLTKKIKKKIDNCDETQGKKNSSYKKSSDEIKDNYNEIILSKPKINFPEEFIINSEKHINKYNKNIIKQNKFYDINDIDLDYNVCDELKILLLCGIGVYIPTLNPTYTSIVLDLSSRGLLNYVISDYNICYGTNHPFSNVIITEEFIKNNNMNTIFQLFGRVGRVGKSYAAYVYVPETYKEELDKYINLNEWYSNEDDIIYDIISKM